MSPLRPSPVLQEHVTVSSVIQRCLFNPWTPRAAAAALDHYMLRDRAAWISYQALHSLLPPHVENMNLDQVMKLIARLMDPSTAPSLVKMTILTLAHHPAPEAFGALQRYVEMAPPELQVFVSLAVEEYLALRLLDEAMRLDPSIPHA